LNFCSYKSAFSQKWNFPPPPRASRRDELGMRATNYHGEVIAGHSSTNSYLESDIPTKTMANDKSIDVPNTLRIGAIA
jgi:hypothetical protein